MSEVLGYTVLGMVACAVAVKAVVWRLAWEDRRNPTPRMKRGEASKLWLLLLVPLAVGVVAVKTGHTDPARWCAAVSLGLPLLFAKAELWTKKASV